MRGLKCEATGFVRRRAFVASYADAWIEIAGGLTRGGGARMSHPTRMRGLKFLSARRPLSAVGVASYADAWIEIAICLQG